MIVAIKSACAFDFFSSRFRYLISITLKQMSYRVYSNRTNELIALAMFSILTKMVVMSESSLTHEKFLFRRGMERKFPLNRSWLKSKSVTAQRDSWNMRWNSSLIRARTSSALTSTLMTYSVINNEVKKNRKF